MPLPIRLGPVVSALAPPLCWSCRGAARAGEPLCHGCRRRLRFLAPEPLQLVGVRLWAAVAFEGPARDLVHGLKYRGAAGLADALAAQIAANAPPSLLPPAAGPPAALARSSARRRGDPAVTLLVPVPAAAARVRRRGFDQAALLAAALARRTGLSSAACLARPGTGSSQVGRGRQARRTALDGAIRLRSPPPPRAVLVDDVVTTGATLRACAGVLREAGCAEVVAIAYARTAGR